MNAIPVLAEGVTMTKIGDENVLFPSYLNEPQIQLASVNDVGYFIVSMIDGVKTILDLAQAVASSYQIDLSAALSDTEEFLHILESKNVLYLTEKVD